MERRTKEEKRGRRTRVKDFEVVGCEPDKEYVLVKIANSRAGSGKVNDADAEVKVVGKWIVETKQGVSTFRIEDEKTLREHQRRKCGFPYRFDSSASSSSTFFCAEQEDINRGERVGNG